MTDIISNIRESVPLIHCITNPISINQCANLILSVGARPIMAEHPEEVCEITKSSDALMLNIGNITDARMKSIKLSASEANKNNIPVLLDVVGISCSKFRRKYIYELLKEHMPTVIKGNYSEIAALYNTEYFSPGVDADASLEVVDIRKAAEELSLKYNSVILATGKTDIITDGKRTVYINNGTNMLASVTGTGCLLGALCTVFLTSASPMDATVSASACFNICGELAETEKGYGSFMVNLLDRISVITGEEISKYINAEDK